MSKELTPLEALEDLASGQYVGAWKDQCVKTVKKSLKALEILKKRIDWKTYLMLSGNTFLEEEYNFLKEALL